MQKYIKILVVLFSLFLFPYCSFASSADDAVTTKTLHEENKALKYTIDVLYPQITATKSDAQVQRFNQFIYKLITEKIVQFKNAVKKDLPDTTKIPGGNISYRYHLDYQFTLIKPQNFASVRFAVESYLARRAHPDHRYFVINYDLKNSKLLAMSDLFKPNADYLDVIANYCAQILNKRLTIKAMINDGTVAKADNYQIWNITPNGLQITFTESQVAPYIFGSQEVMVPYLLLKDIISPQLPIAPCMNGSMPCQFMVSGFGMSTGR